MVLRVGLWVSVVVATHGVAGLFLPNVYIGCFIAGGRLGAFTSFRFDPSLGCFTDCLIIKPQNKVFFDVDDSEHFKRSTVRASGLRTYFFLFLTFGNTKLKHSNGGKTGTLDRSHGWLVRKWKTCRERDDGKASWHVDWLTLRTRNSFN